MDYQERIEKLDDFMKKCDDFNESILEIGAFNLNDGIDDSKSIYRRDSNWRVFENNVNTYFRIYGNAERKEQFQAIIDRFDIDESVISDLIVLFNEMKDDIQIEIKKQVNYANKDLDMSGGEKNGTFGTT